MRQTASLLLLILVLLGSCSTVPQEIKCGRNPLVEEWLDAFDAEYLSKEQCLTLIKGRFDVQKMETIKIISRQWKNGMSALAKKTKKKVDESMRGEE